jgi:sugar fermentation stimulation protein A
LADVSLLDGTLLTAHTNNTGSMLDCSEPGRPVWLSRSDSKTRAHPYGWELIEMPDSLVGVNTLLPNKLAALAAEGGFLTGGALPLSVRREARVGTGRSRLDLLLSMEDGQEILAEVKSSTLVREKVALFPDAVSLRGARHLLELEKLASVGQKAIILVLVQRGGSKSFSPADSIDPGWGAALRRAVDKGVRLMVREVELTTLGAAWGRAIPYEL